MIFKQPPSPYPDLFLLIFIYFLTPKHYVKTPLMAFFFFLWPGSQRGWRYPRSQRHPQHPAGAPRVALLNYRLNEASPYFHRDLKTFPLGQGFYRGGRAGQENASRRHPWEPRTEMGTPASLQPCPPCRALSFPIRPATQSLSSPLCFSTAGCPSVTGARRKAERGRGRSRTGGLRLGPPLPTPSRVFGAPSHLPAPLP